MEQTPSSALLNEIIDRVSVGILVVNKDYELVLWNNYMENYSQKRASEVIGENIFKSFPELPRVWLEQKIRNVFILKNFSFTSWEHRPYLFKFFHNRPITGSIDYMRQNCTFLPIKGESGEIEYVCITLLDVTDTSIYEGMLKSAVKSLAESSNRDGLTNIYNRRYLEQSMSREFARIKRYGGTMSFVIIDLDHFKKINDNYGHLAGDEILKIASKRISECLRESDLLARYGGEEFALMLPETPLEGAAILANRVCKHIAKDLVKFNEFEIHISASLGVAEFQPELETHEQLISRADSVLYVSKDNGRNQITVFDHNDPTKHLHKKEDSSEQNNAQANLISTSEPESASALPVENIVAPIEQVTLNATDASAKDLVIPPAQSEEKVVEESQAEISDAESITEANNFTTEPLDIPSVDTNKNLEPMQDAAHIANDSAITENDSNVISASSITSAEESIEAHESSGGIELNNSENIIPELLPVSVPDQPVDFGEIVISSSAAAIVEVENNKELTYEEKADLAMIAAYGNKLQDEKATVEVIDISSSQIKSDKSESMKTQPKHDTIYVKLGSK